MCAVVSCTVFVYRRASGRPASIPRVTRVRSRAATLGAVCTSMAVRSIVWVGRRRFAIVGPNADRPTSTNKAQRLRNCCWQPAGIPLENLRAILRPFDSPLITPFRTPWRSQVSPISWRNPRVTVPRTTRATPPLIRMTKPGVQGNPKSPCHKRCQPELQEKCHQFSIPSQPSLELASS